jgi:hypothetical protein
MAKIILLFLLQAFWISSFATSITGTITDQKGGRLGFASVTVKDTKKGAVANSHGEYILSLEPGTYTLVCQYVGYRLEERKITVAEKSQTIDFVLSIQELKMDEVVIRKGADPAIEIMRQAIKKRSYYNSQVDSFSVDVYIKGLMRSREIPSKFMGQKIDKKDMEQTGIDSMGKGILYLSESVTKVAFTKPDKIKYEVVSSRQSGGGYGFSFPFFTNFYENNVSVSNANPRGYISPISENAFHFYEFKYEGNFFEGSKMIDRIRVRPKRKNEPLFTGYIQIVDGEWRIHSLELVTSSDYQLELIDTLRITQLYTPVTNDIWRTQNQIVYVVFKKFGFDITGNFLNVYSNYNLAPGFAKKYFDRVIMTYDSAALKKDSSYWTSSRPVPLEPDEKRDYTFKDSLGKAFRDSFSKVNIDSLRKHQKPIKPGHFLFGTVTRNFYSTTTFSTFNLNGLIRELEYNTVEGLAMNVVPSLEIRPRKGNSNYVIDGLLRYGWSNQHLNGQLGFSSRSRGEFGSHRVISFAGGKRIIQFNHDNPIDPLLNTFYTLFGKKNYSKLYENWFGTASYENRLENGIEYNLNALYEDRIPVENSTDYSFFKKENEFLPNHPYELANIPFTAHQALVLSATFSFQPGQRYIQYPHRKISVGSKYPTLSLTYAKGINSWLGSDVDFDKWKFTVHDNMNFKMGGEFRYRFSLGGFLNASQVTIPDFQHFNGNQTFVNFKYLNSFQLAPYYAYSNTESFYTLIHAEHHFNGLLTNKIPLFNKLKWNLVGGTNTFFVNSDNYYAEVFAGLENIFKIFRVDFVTAYQAQPGHNFGVRLGFGGLLGSAVQVNTR